jgi:hypothetical protein
MGTAASTECGRSADATRAARTSTLVVKVITMSGARARVLVYATLLLGAALLVACASSDAPTSSTPVLSPASIGSATSPSASTPPGPSRSTTPSTSASPSTATTPSASTPAAPDVAAARRAALAVYVRSPNNTADPSAGFVWGPAPSSTSPLAPRVVERLTLLTQQGYFGDARCGENYLLGNQVGFDVAPVVVSTRLRADSSVMVVVRGSLAGAHRDLTMTLTQVEGRWQVVDLARGTGPHASIFSATPTC